MLKIPLAALLLGGALTLGFSPSHNSFASENDHELARQALAAGEILPLRTVMDQVEREYPGQIVKIEFERDDDMWVYEIKVLQSGGKLIKIKLDARDGTVLKIKGHGVRHKGER